MNIPNIKSTFVVAVFDSLSAISAAKDELGRIGLDGERVGFISPSAESERFPRRYFADDSQSDDDDDAIHDGVRGAAFGAAGGATLSAGLAASTLLIPGVGPVIAAGALATILGYSAAGAAVGGIFGALLTLGMDEESAVELDRSVRDGKALLLICCRDVEEVNEVRQLVHRFRGTVQSERPGVIIESRESILCGVPLN